MRGLQNTWLRSVFAGIHINFAVGELGGSKYGFHLQKHTLYIQSQCKCYGHMVEWGSETLCGRCQSETLCGRCQPLNFTFAVFMFVHIVYKQEHGNLETWLSCVSNIPSFVENLYLKIGPLPQRASFTCTGLLGFFLITFNVTLVPSVLGLRYMLRLSKYAGTG